MRTPGNRPLRALMAIDVGGPNRDAGRRTEDNGGPKELEQVRCTMARFLLCSDDLARSMTVPRSPFPLTANISSVPYVGSVSRSRCAASCL